MGETMVSSASERTERTASTNKRRSSIDGNMLEQMDLSVPEELFKLKGSTVDDQMVRQILK